MVVAKISTIYYFESDDHTIGYSNSCKRICSESDSYRLFHFKCKESDFKIHIKYNNETIFIIENNGIFSLYYNSKNKKWYNY